jgi:hypothetical protein
MKVNDKKNLQFRYLLWLYKTTKEEFDRIERKFTQVDIDRKLLRSMAGQRDALKRKGEMTPVKFLKDYKDYIDKKEKDGLALKYEGRKLRPEYYHVSLKLEAIEESIVGELGKKALKKIKSLYEQEMRRRIIEAREHQ